MKKKFLLLALLSSSLLMTSCTSTNDITKASSKESATSETSSSSKEDTKSSSDKQTSTSSEKENTGAITSINYFGEIVTLDEHHIYVNMKLANEKCSTYVFNDLLKANEAIKEFTSSASEEDPIIIYLDKGVYWVDDISAENDTVGDPLIGLELSKDYIHIYGMDKDATKTVIAGNRGNREGSTGNWNVMSAGENFVGKDITIGNYVSIDLEYPDDPSLSKAARNGSSITQGQTIIANKYADKWQFENVRFMTRLNAIPGGVKRAYFKDCHIECTDDSIDPATSVVYENCDFDFYGKHPLWGSMNRQLVFMNCIFRNKADAGILYFSKDPSQQTFIDCKFEDTGNGFTSFEWCNDMASHTTLRNYIYNTTYGGKTIEVSTQTSPDSSVYINGNMSLLKAYKVGDTYNSYNILKGEDDWDPNNVKDLVGDYYDIPYYVYMDIEDNQKGTDGVLNNEDTTYIDVSFASSIGDQNIDYDIYESTNSTLIPIKVGDGSKVKLDVVNTANYC